MVDRQMRIGGKWNLLRHLLHGDKSKSNQSRAVDKILHAERNKGSATEIADSLAKRYLPLASEPATPAKDYPNYEGIPAAELDKPFQEAEVRNALFNLNGRSTPGPDGIANKMLRNLDDNSIKIITEEVNRI